MNKLYVLIGLPASGKSTWATNKIKEDKDIILLSSDSLRKELLGDENDQSNNNKVFRELYKQLKDNLNDGKSVIFDATNISYKKRVNFLNEISGIKCKKVAVYFNTPLYMCVHKDKKRNRTVGEGLINKMFLNMNIPSYSEGFDEIIIEDFFENIRLNNEFKLPETFEEYREILNNSIFYKCIDFDQNNKHHSSTLDRHMWKCYEGLKSKGVIDRCTLIASLFHDVGKIHTKTEGVDGNSHYYNHQFVSAQIALNYLLNFKFTKDGLLQICQIIEGHMQPYFIETEKSMNKFIKRYTPLGAFSIFNLHSSDKEAH